MTKAKTDAIIAALMAVVTSIFPVLVLTDAVHLSSDAVAAITLFIGNALVFAGLIVQIASNPNWPSDG